MLDKSLAVTVLALLPGQTNDETLGFTDPISNRRKWVRFVALELWEQINRMLIREVQLLMASHWCRKQLINEEGEDIEFHLFTTGKVIIAQKVLKSW